MQTPSAGRDRDGGHADVGEPLVGDGVTPGIVRIGDTVRRPVRPFTATIQAYLAHLRSVGFTSAPAPLGIDDQGREVLSYVPGDVPREPLPPETTGEDVLAALARLIRQLHDASTGWIPPPDAVWSVQRSGPNVPPPVDGRPELVGHRDYCPGNVVFRGGLPAALIDFDLARPTTRLYDIANALYWWAPLYAPEDRPPAFVGADIPRRAAVFAEAYGMSAEQRRDLVPLARRMIHRFHLSMRAAAADDPVFRALWEDSGMDRLPRAEKWIEWEGPAIMAQLTTPTGSDRAQLQHTRNHLAGHLGDAGWQDRLMADQGARVRAARAGDRDQVWPLARELATSFRPERAAFDASFGLLLTDPHTLFLVAETPGLEITGYLLAFRHPAFHVNGPVAWVEEVMIGDQFRRTGAGRRLMAAAERWARSSGAAYLALATRRAAGFYLALGYEDSAVYFRKTLA